KTAKANLVDLGAMALGDVGQCTGKQPRSPLRASEEFSARADPALFACLAADSVLDFKSTRPPREACLDRILDALPILRMEATMRLQVGTGPKFDSLRNAEQLPRAGGNKHFVRGRNPLPDTVVRSVHGARVASLRITQRLLGTCAVDVFLMQLRIQARIL